MAKSTVPELERTTAAELVAGVPHSAAEGRNLVIVAWGLRFSLWVAAQDLVEKEQSIPMTFACASARAVVVVVDVEQAVQEGQLGEALSVGALPSWH